jgi:hypothetical protein
MGHMGTTGAATCALPGSRALDRQLVPFLFQERDKAASDRICSRTRDSIEDRSVTCRGADSLWGAGSRHRDHLARTRDARRRTAPWSEWRQGNRLRRTEWSRHLLQSRASIHIFRAAITLNTLMAECTSLQSGGLVATTKVWWLQGPNETHVAGCTLYERHAVHRSSGSELLLAEGCHCVRT